MSLKLRLLLFYINHIAGKLDFAQLSPSTFRKLNQKEGVKVKYLIDYQAIELHSVQDKQIEMRDGANIPIRIYRPSAKTNLPIITFFHGGGFVTRSIDSHDRVCRRLAKENQAVVVSVGYRLAPEYKFPVPVHDCYDATVWVANHATQLGGNADQLTVMGDSAGGNLATVVSILARDLKGPKIAYQVLVYPTTDARMQHPSIDQYAQGYFLTKDMMHWFLGHYKNTDTDKFNPLFSPLLSKNLSNLPPAYVITAEYDPLKDEGTAYAEALKTAGNSVIFKEYKGVIHGFFNLPKICKEALVLHEDIRGFLK